MNLETLKDLYELYVRKELGDKFVDIAKSSKNPNLTTMQSSKADSIESKFLESSGDFTSQIAHCKLCDLSKMVRDNERFCGFYPFIESKMQDSKNYPKIAFIIESIQLNLAFSKQNSIISYNLENLAQNKTNEMLLNIIEKVFNLDSKNVYILPRFKCADVGGNQTFSYKIRTQKLENERKICTQYLIKQLENIEYAVFFGENLCEDFFYTTLKNAQGKLLEYAKITCVCVSDPLQMLANPSLKKEAMTSLMLLKNLILQKSL